MPAEDSKPAAPVAEQPDQSADKGKQAEVASDSGSDDEPANPTADDGTAASASASKKKKKKSKRARAKEALTGKPADQESQIKQAISGLTPQQAKELLAFNPALAQEVAQASGTANPSAEQAAGMLQNMNLQDIMTGLAAGGKNAKDMGAYKFWATQPVPKFGEDKIVEEGPLRIQKVEDVPTEHAALVEGFEWVTMDLTDDAEMKEVYELLNGHYVEDDEAMLRFNYSPSILRWAMMSPGWHKRYHIGVRATTSRKLVAFVSAIPVDLRVRARTVRCSEVNFLCVHKKLRGKRLAPVLIKEITRVSNLHGIWQGLYTAGVVLPRPVSTTRYYHRSINWQKLYEVGFSPLPRNSKPQYQVRKYALPDNTATKGLREMKEADVDGVRDLLERYLKRFDMAPEFSKEETSHWFIPNVEAGAEQCIWSYVVEDENKKITDFFSFFCVESSVLNNPKHNNVRVAYLFYYATEAGLPHPQPHSSPERSNLKTRLNALVGDALILAKRAKMDVLNALTIMDSGLFLEQQKFGGGDGQLHYYLFNYRANPIGGGVDLKNELDEKNLSGIGLTLI